MWIGFIISLAAHVAAVLREVIPALLSILTIAHKVIYENSSSTAWVFVTTRSKSKCFALLINARIWRAYLYPTYQSLQPTIKTKCDLAHTFQFTFYIIGVMFAQQYHLIKEFTNEVRWLAVTTVVINLCLALWFDMYLFIIGVQCWIIHSQF